MEAGPAWEGHCVSREGNQRECGRRGTRKGVEHGRCADTHLSDGVRRDVPSHMVYQPLPSSPLPRVRGARRNRWRESSRGERGGIIENRCPRKEEERQEGRSCEREER
eukprot:scaffold156080_cov30-Tisochrysis_lutea.AAC.1